MLINATGPRAVGGMPLSIVPPGTCTKPANVGNCETNEATAALDGLLQRAIPAHEMLAAHTTGRSRRGALPSCRGLRPISDKKSLRTPARSRTIEEIAKRTRACILALESLPPVKE